MNDTTSKPKIGLALGSGASRGWSHIGVIKALLEAGIEPDVVCGTSVGAMVGASYLAGNLEKLEDWVVNSSRTDVLRFFSFRLAKSAFVDLERLNWFLHNYIAAADVDIEDLPKPYAAVCTELKSGNEVSLKNGPVADAVRASMAMPGLFPAVRNDDRWLVDGGLVNPVPVSACRALGAEIVIGVNLNHHILERNYPKAKEKADKDESNESAQPDGFLGELKQQVRAASDTFFSDDGDESPGLFATIAHTINIFQDQITKSRLKADPADVLVAPQVSDIRMLDFRRAADAIQEGESCVQDALDEIQSLIRNSDGGTTDD